ncbi:MAG: hypothetical protein U0234_05055 [Sandaracinus sp.]
MVSERQKLGVSATVSVVGHLVAAGLLLLAPRTSDLHLAQADEIAIEIDDTPPPPPPALVVTPPETPPVAETVHPRVTDRPSVPDQASGAVIQTSTSPALAPTTPLVAVPTTPTHEPTHDTVVVPPEQMHQLLDPTRVAAADALHDDEGPSQPGPPATLHPESPDHGPTAQEAVAQTEEYLGARAAEKTYITQRTFHLTPHTDGTLHWQGTGFEAVIHPDGTVTFSDHPDVSMDWSRGQGGFDITDMIMHGAGQDPYAAEREWFMDHAEATVERLEREARERHATDSMGNLRSRLREIWSDTSEPASSRRRQIFELWDELEDGEGGAPARQAVISFIRREIPESGADSYTMIELARLNANRESAERFDPYP